MMLHRALQQWVCAKYERCQFTEGGPTGKGPGAAPEFLEISVSDPQTQQDPDGKNKYTSYSITASVRHYNVAYFLLTLAFSPLYRQTSRRMA